MANPSASACRLVALASLLVGGCYLSHPLDGPASEPAPPPTSDDPPTAAPDSGPPVGPPDPTDPRDVRDACESGEAVSRTVSLSLPGNATRQCPWGVGDNLAPAQERASARIEDVTDRIVPDDVVLCALELDFEVESTFRYDDNFVLLFGDAVLAASDRSLVARLASRSGVRSWDWSRIAGAPMLVMGSDPYCVGADDGLARCTLPESDLADRLSLAFEQPLVDELSFRAFEAGRADFTVVAIGDNDPTTDCQYTPLTVRAAVTYVRVR